MRRKAAGEESPGSMETRCRVTPGGGDPRESATESKPPARARPSGRVLRPVRVKGCGKSAPRLRRRRRHGKPHREQDRVGAAGPATGQAGFRAAARVGRARRPATGVPDEWSSPRGVRARRDRTRLTGRLTPSPPGKPRPAAQRLAPRRAGFPAGRNGDSHYLTITYYSSKERRGNKLSPQFRLKLHLRIPDIASPS